ncbi:MAG TPA: fused MFS/spermidine synthase, partial [Bacteroidia bacterium]|nr:fused MFS/spermidine synthase [Bacteroidia bacterium]
AVLAAAVYMCCLPLFSSAFLYLANSASLIPAVLMGSAIVLLPPVLLMGMVSPLLITSLTTSKEESGKRAGEVYAISTLGGILFCFLTGFFFIPNMGLRYTLSIISFLLAIFPCVYFLKIKNFVPAIIYFLSIAFILAGPGKKSSSVYLSDGLLGRLEVRDDLYQPNQEEKPDSCRLLLMNNVIQSAVNLKNGNSELEYTALLEKNLTAATTHPKTALLLGLGGGVQANELCKENIEVTAIELDRRVIGVAKCYFNLNRSVVVIEDDARHALYNIHKKFDFVMIDLFHAEITPAHVMSFESFTKIRSLLNENGLLVINTYGYLKSKAGYGNLILMNTLRNCGFNFRVCYVGDKTNEDFRNFEIFATVRPIEQTLANQLEEEIPGFAHFPVNTDDRPLLEEANALAAKQWRSSYLRSSIVSPQVY